MNNTHRITSSITPWAALGLAAALLSGCDRDDRPANPAPASTAPAASSLWHSQNHSAVVAIKDEPSDRELAAAIAQARASADNARKRWAFGKLEDQPRWFVKWAAPLASDAAAPPSAPNAPNAVEHVWVRPVNWSAFRIEGVLLTAPVSQLDCGKSLGELVSFPIDELSDWIHLETEDFNGPHDGGFTVAVLEKRYGKPG